MKFLKILLINTVVCITIASCTTVRTSEVVNLGFDPRKGSSAGGDFIQLNDGKIMRGAVDKFKLQLGLINKNKGTVTMDNVAYRSNDIMAFQQDSTYYRKLKGTTYFMQRKKAGKINLYFRHFSAETYSDSKGKYKVSPAYDLHWLQKGSDGEIQKYNLKLLESMVSDNTEATNLINNYKEAKNRNKKNSDLDKAIDIYNRS